MDIQVTYITVNRRGQPQRDQQRIPGPTLTIGRGAQCQIHLPDPRIALTHAQITLSEEGATITAPEAGRLQVNGRGTDGARLTVGDSVEVGPYLLEVETPPAGIPLAVSVKLAVPLAPAGVSRFQLRAPRLSKRRLSYLAFFGTLLLCLLIPAAPSLLGHPTMVSVGRATQADKQQYYLNTGTTLTEQQYYVSKLAEDFLQSWNPGPVSAAHQVIGSDCRACHQFPFVQVRDMSCVGCHKQIAQHVVPEKSAAGEGAASDQLYGRCTTCHRDHKGTQMAPHGQAECTSCHGSEERMQKIVAGVTNFKCDAPDGKPAKVMDFDTCHPEFRLAVQDPPKQRDPDPLKKSQYTVRWVDLGSKDMVESSNLKFDHKLHLDPQGIRERVGKLRSSDPAKDKADGKDPQNRRLLHCSDCHQPLEGGRAEVGRLIAPVTFEQHCQSCHSLQFEPGRPQREVAHKPPAELLDDLIEFYARRVLGSVAGDGKAPEALRARPGAQTVTAAQRGEALKEAEARARVAFNELFTEGPEKKARDVCVTCHKLSRTTENPGWQVAPVHVTKEWMPKGRFTHAKHLNMRGGRTADENCLECHKGVQDSKTSDTVAMPEIKICRDCHVSVRPVEHVEGKITSECSMCHSFHFSKQLWFGEMQAPQRKKKEKVKE